MMRAGVLPSPRDDYPVQPELMRIPVNHLILLGFGPHSFQLERELDVDTVSPQVAAYCELQTKARTELNLEWLHSESSRLDKQSQISVEAAASQRANPRFETLVALFEILVVHCASCLLETQQEQSFVVQVEFWPPVAAELHSEPNQVALQHSLLAMTFQLWAFAALQEKVTTLAEIVEYLLLD